MRERDIPPPVPMGPGAGLPVFARPPSAAQMTFPIGERTAELDIEKQRYRLTIKGHTVVGIDPPGRFCPFYQRDHYRENTVRWKKVARFVSEEQVLW